jgi:hypothetical protein
MQRIYPPSLEDFPLVDYAAPFRANLNKIEEVMKIGKVIKQEHIRSLTADKRPKFVAESWQNAADAYIHFYLTSERCYELQNEARTRLAQLKEKGQSLGENEYEWAKGYSKEFDKYWKKRNKALEELYYWQEWEEITSGNRVYLKWIPPETYEIINFVENYSKKQEEKEREKELKDVVVVDVKVNGPVMATEKIRDEPVHSLGVPDPEKSIGISVPVSEKETSATSIAPTLQEDNKSEKKTTEREDGKRDSKGKDEPRVEDS